MTEVFSATALAKLFQVHPKTVRRWESAGHFPPPIRLSSRRLVWTRADIESWLLTRPPLPVLYPPESMTAALSFVALPAWHQVVVSGHAPVPAQQVGSGHAFVSLTVSSLALARATQMVHPDGSLTLHPRTWLARCGQCRGWMSLAKLQDDVLGWRGWCQACLREGLRHCLARHDRLPRRATEFWCPACGGIYPHGDRAPNEADGRRRLRCLRCRRWQWLARDARRSGRPVPPQPRCQMMPETVTASGAPTAITGSTIVQAAPARFRTDGSSHAGWIKG